MVETGDRHTGYKGLAGSPIPARMTRGARIGAGSDPHLDVGTDFDRRTCPGEHFGWATTRTAVMNHYALLGVLDTVETRGPDDDLAVKMITVGEKHRTPPRMTLSACGHSSWDLLRPSWPAGPDRRRADADPGLP